MKKKFLDLEIQGQGQFFGNFQIEGVEFICDSHGQTFLSTLYGRVDDRAINWEIPRQIGQARSRKALFPVFLPGENGSRGLTKKNRGKLPITPGRNENIWQHVSRGRE